MAQLPPDSQALSASQRRAVAHRRHLGARLGTDPQHRGPGGCHDLVFHGPPAGFDTVDGRHREGDNLGPSGARVLHDVAAHIHRRIDDAVRLWRQRDARSDIQHPDTGDHDLHALGDRRRRRGHHFVALLERRTGCRQQQPHIRRRQPPVAGHTAVVDVHLLRADQRQRHAGQWHSAGTRCGGGGGIAYRQLLESLVDSRRRRPHLFALPAVHRHLQRPAASQHDGVGLMDRLIGGRIELVVVADGEAVIPHHVDHPRLHRPHRHR